MTKMFIILTIILAPITSSDRFDMLVGSPDLKVYFDQGGPRGNFIKKDDYTSTGFPFLEVFKIMNGDQIQVLQLHFGLMFPMEIVTNFQFSQIVGAVPVQTKI